MTIRQIFFYTSFIILLLPRTVFAADSGLTQALSESIFAGCLPNLTAPDLMYFAPSHEAAWKENFAITKDD